MRSRLTSSGRRYPRLWLALFLAGSSGGLTLPATASGVMTNVSIIDNQFSPPIISIHQGDSVKWTWNGTASHSSTGPGTPPLWDSGILPSGSAFTNTFNTAGTFAYRCVVHFSQTGSITVQAVANVPPTISIGAPTNGANFAAPWTGTIQATASDSDDTVKKVDFYSGTSLLGTVSNPPASLSMRVSNVVAGSYALTAVATDSRGASATSAVVNVNILTPAAINLSAPRRVSANTFQLLYTATPGLNYVVQRSSSLSVFTALSTNTAATNNVTYTDTSATGVFNVYSVKLLPNP